MKIVHIVVCLLLALLLCGAQCQRTDSVLTADGYKSIWKTDDGYWNISGKDQKLYSSELKEDIFIKAIEIYGRSKAKAEPSSGEGCFTAETLVLTGGGGK